MTTIHSGIKVGTIVNIMRVNDEFLNKIFTKQEKQKHYKEIGNEEMAFLIGIELEKEKSKYGEFLDFYI